MGGKNETVLQLPLLLEVYVIAIKIDGFTQFWGTVIMCRTYKLKKNKKRSPSLHVGCTLRVLCKHTAFKASKRQPHKEWRKKQNKKKKRHCGPQDATRMMPGRCIFPPPHPFFFWIGSSHNSSNKFPPSQWSLYSPHRFLCLWANSAHSHKKKRGEKKQQPEGKWI